MNHDMQRCPHCGAFIVAAEDICPRCHEPLSTAPPDDASSDDATLIQATPRAALPPVEPETPDHIDQADPLAQPEEPPREDSAAPEGAPGDEVDAESAAHVATDELPTLEQLPAVEADDAEPILYAGFFESTSSDTPDESAGFDEVDESAPESEPVSELELIPIATEGDTAGNAAVPIAPEADAAPASLPEGNDDTPPVEATQPRLDEQIAADAAPYAVPAGPGVRDMGVTQPGVPPPGYLIPPAPYTPPPVAVPVRLTPPPAPPVVAPPVYAPGYGAGYAPGYGAPPDASTYMQQRVGVYMRGGYQVRHSTPREVVLSHGKSLGVGGWILALFTLIGAAWYVLIVALSGFHDDRVYITLEDDGRVYEEGSGAAHVRWVRARTGRRWAIFGLSLLLIGLLLACVLTTAGAVLLSQDRYQAAVREAYPAVTLFEEHFSPAQANPDDVSLARDGAVGFAILAGIAVIGVWGGATLAVIGTIHAGAYRVDVPPLPGWS